MQIKTNEPVLLGRDKIMQTVAKFWDQISEGWRTVWGQHIHHGYYENELSVSPQQAQERLIVKLIELIQIPSHARILDVGCGMGGSSIFLANKYDATVTGITLSPQQVAIATKQATVTNTSNVAFKVEDALSLASFADNSIDIVWSLESCEQFYDKELFIQQAFRVLKPGGQLMLATWCSDRDEYQNIDAKKYLKLCQAFDVPYMPTIDHYHAILLKCHFSTITAVDWSSFVKKSWDVGLTLVSAYSFLQILKMAGWRGFRFAKQVRLMRDAFNEGRIQYGVFTATKR